MLSSIRNKRKRGMCYAIIDGSRGQGECNMQDWRQGGNQIVSGLGFVVGAIVTVISEIQGNLIVNVKDSRVAIGKDMAGKILVS